MADNQTVGLNPFTSTVSPFGINTSRAFSSILSGFSGFGGGRNRRPGFTGIDTSPFIGTFLEGFRIPGGQEVRGRSFSQGGTALQATSDFIGPLLERERKLLRSIGRGDLADDLFNAASSIVSGTPGSQQEVRDRHNRLLAAAGQSIKLRTSLFDAAGSNAGLSSQFKSSTGLSVADFRGEIGRQDQSFRKRLELPGLQRGLESAQKASRGFSPIFTGRKRKGGTKGGLTATGQLGRSVKIGKSSRQRQIISAAELSSRKAGAASQAANVRSVRSFINAPGLDISRASPQFGRIFGQTPVGGDGASSAPPETPSSALLSASQSGATPGATNERIPTSRATGVSRQRTVLTNPLGLATGNSRRRRALLLGRANPALLSTLG